jgi:release factor glutamine methyltransferase
VTYDALLREVTKKALKYNKEVEAIKLLLLELSGLAPHEFYVALKEEVDDAFALSFKEKADLYMIDAVPIQHILGYSYFYGYTFQVSKDVLIPRVETEQLVEHVLYYYDHYFTNQKVKVIDLGTGSGCIGLTLAKEEPNMYVTVTDISEKALDIARVNGKNLGVDSHYVKSDWFSDVKGKYDIILSNPPYIPSDEDVQDIVKKEPEVALYGGGTGTIFYQHILSHVKPYMNETCLIGFEHGYQQRDAILDLVHMYLPEAHVIQLKDLQGRDRFTFLGFGGVLKDD